MDRPAPQHLVSCMTEGSCIFRFTSKPSTVSSWTGEDPNRSLLGGRFTPHADNFLLLFAFSPEEQASAEENKQQQLVMLPSFGAKAGSLFSKKYQYLSKRVLAWGFCPEGSTAAVRCQ
jgi:hypothetical protein